MFCNKNNRRKNYQMQYGAIVKEEREPSMIGITNQAG